MFTSHSSVRMSFANPNPLPLSRPHVVNSFKPSTTSPAAPPPPGIPATTVVAPAKAAPAGVDVEKYGPDFPDTRSPIGIMFGESSFVRAFSPSASASSASSPTSSPASASPSVNPARTVVITGASGGIGFETVKGLLASLPKLELLILAVRDVSRTRAAIASLKLPAACPAIEIVQVNLSDSDSVVDCVDAVYDLIANRPLDLLICNAGLMAPPLQYSRATITVSSPVNEDETTTSDSQLATTVTTAIEQQYFINFVSQALLTDRLLPLLRQSEGARVVFVSSLAVSLASGRSTAPSVAEKTGNVVTNGNYSRWGCYADSKLAMSMFAKALSMREGDKIEFVSLHPGVVQTDLARHLVPKWLQFQIPDPVAALFGLLSPEQGARLSLDLAKAMPCTLDNGAMYTSLGRKKADPKIIPLLDDQQALDNLFNDTKVFIDSI